ncbi:MAG: HNH endonuclease [Candidatus Dadabacteria bacterium]|nr:HNH endonuclease [Candidatus Dadabacteria bacterium]
MKKDNSLLFDEPGLWNEENLNIAVNCMLGDLRTDEGDFKSKLQGQFYDYDINHKIWLLLCELLALHYCPNVQVEKFFCFERTISKERLDYQTLYDKVLIVKDIDGVARLSQNYNGKQWFSIGYYASLALKYKRDENLQKLIKDLRNGNPRWEDAEESLNSNNIIDSKFKIDKTGSTISKFNMPHPKILLHILCRNYHSNIMTRSDRKLFFHYFENKYLADQEKEKEENEKIYLINKRVLEEDSDLPKRRNSELVNFYSNKLKHLWKKERDHSDKKNMQCYHPLTKEQLDKKGGREVEKITIKEKEHYKTDPNIKQTVLQNSNFKCQFDETHQTFEGKNNTPFVEAHHLIPMAKAGEFYPKQIDLAENIVSLCPNCHRAVHLGNKEEKKIRLKKLYDIKIDGLTEKGFNITFKKLMQFYK